MSIVILSDAYIQKLSPHRTTILRDKILCGLCLKVGKRSHSFLVATSVGGKQFRMTLGRWPIINVEEARELAAPILKNCRIGLQPIKRPPPKLPTLYEALGHYCEAKKLKPTSRERYESIVRTHFADWKDLSVAELSKPAFSENCHRFARKSGASLVEVGRGFIGALFKYLNAVHGQNLESPFTKLAASGLLPEHAKPRARKLKEADLPQWRKAVDSILPMHRDFLLLLAYTGMRRNEWAFTIRSNVEFDRSRIYVPDTKTNRPHSLPITPKMREILLRRCEGLSADDCLFHGLAVEHVADMAIRAGAPKFILHDLRKLLATVGEKLGYSDSIMRRILNHSAKRSDTLYRHYVEIGEAELFEPLIAIQNSLEVLMAQTPNENDRPSGMVLAVQQII